MNFKHVPFNITILSLQGVPFPRLFKHKGIYLENTIIPFSFIFCKKAEDVTKDVHTQNLSLPYKHAQIHPHYMHHLTYTYRILRQELQPPKQMTKPQATLHSKEMEISRKQSNTGKFYSLDSLSVPETSCTQQRTKGIYCQP